MEPEFYLPNGDCADGAECPGEGVFIPQQIGNTELDAIFVGSDADVQADLGLADIDSYPLTDEVFPVICDGALLTLDGLMDCFARKYPERMDLLNGLMEKHGYRVTFEENPSAAEAELESWIDDYAVLVRRQTREVGDNDRDLLNAMRATLAQRRSELNAMRHWHIAPGRIYLSTRINRNIDVNNLLMGDDDDEINRAPTNAEGADWLNAVMGDWMVRSGIPGAAGEEFSDSRSGRIAWGAFNIIFGAAEVIGGVVLTLGTLGMGTVAGGALSLAGFEAITQGIDMWRTPEESAHGTGWLGDGTFAMMNHFGVLDENDQKSFNRYWSFAMLGLSLGGAGILGYAGDAVQANRAGTIARLDFVANAPARALATARKAIVGVQNARFGQLKVNYAPMPSGRIAMNIEGVGRVVAPHWESITRLRARMNTSTKRFVEQRAGKLSAGRAGLASLRGGISSAADARRLVEEALEISGISASRLEEFISSVNFSAQAAVSSFIPSRTVVTIRGGIGTGIFHIGPFNELKAINEALHEVRHAMHRHQYFQRNGSLDGFENVIGRARIDPKYAKEEVAVETAAQERMLTFANARIAGAELAQDTAEASRLRGLLADALEDSNAYIEHWSRKTGE